MDERCQDSRWSNVVVSANHMVRSNHDLTTLTDSIVSTETRILWGYSAESTLSRLVPYHFIHFTHFTHLIPSTTSQDVLPRCPWMVYPFLSALSIAFFPFLFPLKVHSIHHKLHTPCTRTYRTNCGSGIYISYSIHKPKNAFASAPTHPQP
jgi:hypothetical protein